MGDKLFALLKDPFSSQACDPPSHCERMLTETGRWRVHYRCHRHLVGHHHRHLLRFLYLATLE